ncbi:unnamed protein product [Adineta ricciae]|uniref:ADP ribosyltransferase domain-containing protein n=1 Tax=Adineta ricciae TaxID=249248 RepID=A0A815UW14_ADIRI|nr:unnamed protein product [Adineta ricciae]CAF1621065.1 unnamed protein product [Adineta ricciae]
MDDTRDEFICVWLDSSVDSTEENRNIQKKLRQIIENLRMFENADICEKYLRKTTKESLILIVSGTFGRQILPSVHNLPQLISFYVFCQDKKGNEQWAKKYSKLSCVCTTYVELINCVSKDHSARTGTEDNPLISVISSTSDNLEARNATFMWFQLFIEVLLRMHHKKTDRKELINICKKTYINDTEVLNIIDEFEKNYTANEAVWWYTRDACFYRMINKALRNQDFDMLFTFRCFITDIAKQVQNGYEDFIRTNGSRSLIKVYRGQMISMNELELMKNNIDGFLSMNSFLSTSRDRAVAIHFARTSQGRSRMRAILFEIEIDPKLRTKAFADISKKSDYQSEHEVLIMLGALFCIKSITEDAKDQMLVVRVSLASDDDYHLKELFAHMKGKIGDDTNLDTLGKLLIRMDESQQARKCYQRLVREAQLALADAELGLGWASLKCHESKDGLEHFQQALEIRQRLLGENHPDVAEIFSFLGESYRLMDDYDQALIYLNKAKEIEEKTLPSNSLNLAATYDTLGTTYCELDQHDLALIYYEKVLKIRQAALPSNHPQIAAIYAHLGYLFKDKGDYSKALSYYKKSLEIARKAVSPGHCLVTNAQDKIRELKEKIK